MSLFRLSRLMPSRFVDRDLTRPDGYQSDELNRDSADQDGRFGFGFGYGTGSSEGDEDIKTERPYSPGSGSGGGNVGIGSVADNDDVSPEARLSYAHGGQSGVGNYETGAGRSKGRSGSLTQARPPQQKGIKPGASLEGISPASFSGKRAGGSNSNSGSQSPHRLPHQLMGSQPRRFRDPRAPSPGAAGLGSSSNGSSPRMGRVGPSESPLIDSTTAQQGSFSISSSPLVEREPPLATSSSASSRVSPNPGGSKHQHQVAGGSGSGSGGFTVIPEVGELGTGMGLGLDFGSENLYGTELLRNDDIQEGVDPGGGGGGGGGRRDTIVPGRVARKLSTQSSGSQPSTLGSGKSIKEDKGKEKDRDRDGRDREGEKGSRFWKRDNDGNKPGSRPISIFGGGLGKSSGSASGSAAHMGLRSKNMSAGPSNESREGQGHGGEGQKQQDPQRRFTTRQLPIPPSPTSSETGDGHAPRGGGGGDGNDREDEKEYHGHSHHDVVAEDGAWISSTNNSGREARPVGRHTITGSGPRDREIHPLPTRRSNPSLKSGTSTTSKGSEGSKHSGPKSGGAGGGISSPSPSRAGQAALPVLPNLLLEYLAKEPPNTSSGPATATASGSPGSPFSHQQKSSYPSHAHSQESGSPSSSFTASPPSQGQRQLPHVTRHGSLPPQGWSDKIAAAATLPSSSKVSATGPAALPAIPSHTPMSISLASYGDINYQKSPTATATPKPTSQKSRASLRDKVFGESESVEGASTSSSSLNTGVGVDTVTGGSSHAVPSSPLVGRKADFPQIGRKTPSLKKTTGSYEALASGFFKSGSSHGHLEESQEEDERRGDPHSQSDTPTGPLGLTRSETTIASGATGSTTSSDSSRRMTGGRTASETQPTVSGSTGSKGSSIWKSLHLSSNKGKSRFRSRDEEALAQAASRQPRRASIGEESTLVPGTRHSLSIEPSGGNRTGIARRGSLNSIAASRPSDVSNHPSSSEAETSSSQRFDKSKSSKRRQTESSTTQHRTRGSGASEVDTVTGDHARDGTISGVPTFVPDIELDDDEDERVTDWLRKESFTRDPFKRRHRGSGRRSARARGVEQELDSDSERGSSSESTTEPDEDGNRFAFASDLVRKPSQATTRTMKRPASVVPDSEHGKTIEGMKSRMMNRKAQQGAVTSEAPARIEFTVEPLTPSSNLGPLTAPLPAAPLPPTPSPSASPARPTPSPLGPQPQRSRSASDTFIESLSLTSGGLASTHRQARGKLRTGAGIDAIIPEDELLSDEFLSSAAVSPTTPSPVRQRQRRSYPSDGSHRDQPQVRQKIVDGRTIDVDFVVAVVGPRGAGKSTVIQRGLKRPMGGATTLNEDEVGNKIISQTAQISLSRKPRVVEVLEIDMSMLSYNNQGLVWPKDLPELDGAMICYDATDPNALDSLTFLLHAFWVRGMDVPLIVLACKSSPEEGVNQTDLLKAASACNPFGAGIVSLDGGVDDRSRKMKNSFTWLFRKIVESRGDTRPESSASVSVTRHERRHGALSPSGSRPTSPDTVSAGLPRHKSGVLKQPSLLDLSPDSNAKLTEEPSATSESPTSVDQGKEEESKRSVSLEAPSLPETTYDEQPSERASPEVTPVKPRQESERRPLVGGDLYLDRDAMVDKLLHAAVTNNDPQYVTSFLIVYRRFTQPHLVLSKLVSKFEMVTNKIYTDPLLSRFIHMKLCNLLGYWVRTYPTDFCGRSTFRVLKTFLQYLIGGGATHVSHYAVEMLPLLPFISRQVDPDLAWGIPDRFDLQDEIMEPLPPPPPPGPPPQPSPGTPPRKHSVASTTTTDGGSSQAGTTGSNSLLMVPAGTPGSTATKLQSVQSGRNRSVSDAAMSGMSSTSERSSAMGSGGRGNSSGNVPPAQSLPKSKYHVSLVEVSNAILDVDEEALAIQISRLAWQIFSHMKPRDLIRYVLAPRNPTNLNEVLRDNRTPVRQSFDFSNYLAEWVASIILAQSKEKNRQRMIEKMILVAYSLRKMDNFDSLFGILMGLGCQPVFRLEADWAVVEARLTHKRFLSLKKLMSSNKSFSAYRLAVSVAESTMIPYIGVHLQDITTINELKPDMRDGQVNWTKFQQVARAAAIIFDCERLAPDLPVDEHIESLIVNVPTLDEDAQYDKSKLLHPSTGNRPLVRSSSKNRLRKWVQAAVEKTA